MTRGIAPVRMIRSKACLALVCLAATHCSLDPGNLARLQGGSKAGLGTPSTQAQSYTLVRLGATSLALVASTGSKSDAPLVMTVSEISDALTEAITSLEKANKSPRATAESLMTQVMNLPDGLRVDASNPEIRVREVMLALILVTKGNRSASDSMLSAFGPSFEKQGGAALATAMPGLGSESAFVNAVAYGAMPPSDQREAYQAFVIWVKKAQRTQDAFGSNVSLFRKTQLGAKAATLRQPSAGRRVLGGLLKMHNQNLASPPSHPGFSNDAP